MLAYLVALELQALGTPPAVLVAAGRIAPHHVHSTAAQYETCGAPATNWRLIM